MLQYFLNKKGPAIYTLTEDDLKEVKVQSAAIVRDVIYLRVMQYVAKNGVATLNGASIEYDGTVRWISTNLVIGAGYAAAHSGDIMDRNESMFAAFGGAHLKLTGKVSVTSQTNTEIVFSLKADITISDTYTFKPAGARLLFSAYEAAHVLETQYDGYKPFKDEGSFTNTYEGLILKELCRPRTKTKFWGGGQWVL